MNFFVFILGIVLFLSTHIASATWISVNIAHAKKLEKILQLDSITLTKIRRIQRNNLFEGITNDIWILRSTWSLRPTFDVTMRYTPYLQKYALSCEIAALSMILKSLWSPKSEDQIISLLPHFPEAFSGGIWWDPDKEFVWSITGSQRKFTGYWVYPYPLSKVLDKDISHEIYTLSPSIPERKILAKGKMKEYLNGLKSGRHVILWWDWCTRKEYEDGILSGSKSQIIRFFPISGKNECERDIWDRYMSWLTPEWEKITWLSGEHAFVLLGYIGKKENPSHIIVWDTDTGRHVYPIDEWMRKWEMLDFRALLMSKH